MINIDRPRHAVSREVWIGRVEHNRAVDPAGINLYTERISRSKGIVLLDAGGNSKTVGTGKARTQRQVTGRFFHNRNGQIHLIRRTRNLLSFNRDFLEKAQAVNSIARQLYLVRVVPSGFELPEFAAHHLVTRTCVARHANPSNISPTRGRCLQNQSDPIVDPVNFRRRIHLRKRIAKISEIIGKGLRGLRHLISVISLTRPDSHKRFEFVILAEIVTFELDAGHYIPLSLCHIDGDVNTLLVRGNNNLGGVDAELKVSARKVVRPQSLNVGVQLGAGILVRLGVPTQPTAGVQVKKVAQGGLTENLVTNNTNFFNLCTVTFCNRES